MRHRDPTLIVDRQHRRSRRQTHSLPPGVNLSAVLIHGEDILGDGVNIAARLEGVSGGIGSLVSADPRLGTRPHEQETAARIGCEKQGRVSALSNRVILAFVAIRATNQGPCTPGIARLFGRATAHPVM
jgi:hypothetical protein